jgi:hypothetical protein
LQRCIGNLQQFGERLDELNTFFILVHQSIERIDKDRVEELIEGAETTRQLIDAAKPELREAKKQKRMDVSLYNERRVRVRV